MRRENLIINIALVSSCFHFNGCKTLMALLLYLGLGLEYIPLSLSLIITVFWAGYWVVHVLALLYGIYRLHRKVLLEASREKPLPGVSILKALVGVDPNLFSNLETFFTLKYPLFDQEKLEPFVHVFLELLTAEELKWALILDDVDRLYEVLFCVHCDSDPSLMLVRTLMTKYPNVDAKVFIGGKDVGLNPKINNLLPAYEEAKYELILISDSGIRMKEDTLLDIVDAMSDNVGIVTQMPFTCDRKGFSATLEKVFFGTAHARIYLVAHCLGFVCSTGMSSLMRKRLLDEAGGMKAFGAYIAEDYFFGHSIASRGWGCAISSQPAWQNSGTCEVTCFLDRLRRWTKVRVAMLPQTILLEPLQECMFLGLLTSLAVSVLFDWNSLIFFLVHVLVWMLSDYCLLRIVQNTALPFGKFEFAVSWLYRECIALPNFLRALYNQEIVWRTGTYKLRWGGIAEAVNATNCTKSSGTSVSNGSKVSKV